jgi:transposase-like protein
MNGVSPLHEEGGNLKKQSFDQKGPFVKKCKNRKDSEQGETINAEQIFRSFMQQETRRALMKLMACEVSHLCGEAYAPRLGNKYRRAGSGSGRAYFEGQAESVKRPRVRETDDEGLERESALVSYELGRSREHLSPQIMQMMEGGMSLRGIDRMGKKGFSASTAQKILVEESAKNIVRLRERDLSQEDFLGLMIDGVFLAKEVVVLVAIGFCTDGRKVVLDFVWGSTENYELSRDLLSRLVKRGFRSATERLLAVVDGADGIIKAIREFFPTVELQRCWVHKERNLHTYLSRKDHPRCSQLMDRVRKAQGSEDGESAYADLKGFLEKRNQGAVVSLQEAGEDLLTFHRLNVPSTLNISFLSTNLIENVMLNYRRTTKRVTKWSGKEDQVDRWSSMALLQAEEGFRKIRHHRDLPKLITALGGLRPPVAPGCVPDSALRAADPTDQTSSTPPGARTRRSL